MDRQQPILTALESSIVNWKGKWCWRWHGDKILHLFLYPPLSVKKYGVLTITFDECVEVRISPTLCWSQLIDFGSRQDRVNVDRCWLACELDFVGFVACSDS